MSDPRLPAAAAEAEDLLDGDDLNGVDPDEIEEGADGSEDGDAVGAGGLEAEPGAADEDGEDEARHEGQARDVGRRGSPRVQRLANENRELKTRFAALEREIQNFRQQARQPTQAEIAEQQRVEYERVSMMAPHEVAQYYAQKTEQVVGQRFAQVERHLVDRADRTDYDNLLAQTPNYRRFDDKVQELLPQAPGVPRRILLATAIGMAAMENAGRARTRGQRQADAGRARQQARPSSGGRGDVASTRGQRQGSADGSFEHLRGVNI